MNRLKGEVEIVLDRPRKIRLDMNALCEAEQTLGSADLVTKTFMEYGFRGIRALLYHGLRADDPTLTLQKTGELMNLKPASEINGLLLKAWNFALTGEESVKKPADGTDPNAESQPPDGTGAKS